MPSSSACSFSAWRFVSAAGARSRDSPSTPAQRNRTRRDDGACDVAAVRLGRSESGRRADSRRSLAGRGRRSGRCGSREPRRHRCGDRRRLVDRRPRVVRHRALARRAGARAAGRALAARIRAREGRRATLRGPPAGIPVRLAIPAGGQSRRGRHGRGDAHRAGPVHPHCDGQRARVGGDVDRCGVRARQRHDRSADTVQYRDDARPPRRRDHVSGLRAEASAAARDRARGRCTARVRRVRHGPVRLCSPHLVRVCALTVLAYAFVLGVPAASAQPGPQQGQQKEPVQPAITPIPVPEIAQRAEQVPPTLRSVEQIAAGPDVQDIEARLPAAGEWIRGRLAGTTQALASSPSANALATLADSWRVMRGRLAAWNDILTRRATQLEQGANQLEAMRATWSASRAKAVASRAPAAVIARIDTTMAAIVAAQGGVGERLTHVLGVQDRVVREIARCDDVLSRIGEAGAALAGPLLSRDGLPIWSPEARTLIATDAGRRLRESVGDSVTLTREFLASQLARVPFQIALLVVVLVLARLARAGARRRAASEPGEQVAPQVFELPLSSALVLTLLASLWIYPDAPRVLVDVVQLLVLLPAVLIVRRLASPAVVPAVYALAAFFLVDRVRDVCAVVPVLEQWVFLLEMVSGIVFLSLAVRSEQLLADRGDQAALAWRDLIAWILWAQLSILVGAVFTGALGHMRLARLLGGEVLASSYIALVLYAGVRVGEGLVAYVLGARPMRQLFMVQRHRALLQRRIDLTLRWLSIATWAYLTLDGLGVMDSLWSTVVMALDARYGRGSISLSLADVAAFGLTVWAA